MPDEIALLLPTNRGPKDLIQAAVQHQALFRDKMLGLFLAAPFLDLRRESQSLAKADIKWIINIPSVEQHDKEFTQLLSDVSLGHGREIENLAYCRDAGIRVAVVVSDAESAINAIAINPEVLIVLPNTMAYAAGYPSTRQRGTATQIVSQAVRAKGWNGPILGLGELQEVAHENLWPESYDGMICRPRNLTDD